MKTASILLKENSGYEEVITDIKKIEDLTMLLGMYIDSGYTLTSHIETNKANEYYLAKEC